MIRFIIGGLALYSALASAGCGNKQEHSEPAPVPVDVERVASRDIKPVWRYSGDIRPDSEVQLAFKQSGYVVSLHQVRGADKRLRDVQVGDEVPAGTVLAQIRRSDNLAALVQANGQKKSSEGSVEAAAAQVDQAKADETKAARDYERAKQLYGVKAMTKPDYDSAEANYKSAAAKVDEATRTVKNREGQLQTSTGQVETAQINLGDTRLIAPIPSLIVSKMVEPGSLVSNGTTGFTVADARVVKIEFGVPDSMLRHFHLGASLRVDVEAASVPPLTGTITQVAASANQDSRVFDVQVSLPNRDRSLKVGMIASVQIEQQEDVQTVPMLPVTALSTAESGSTNFSVFVVREENGKQYAKLRSVRVGETIGRSVAIEQGLTPGERIIVNRPDQLPDGALVRAANEGAPHGR